MGLPDDAPPQEVVLALAGARQDVDDVEVSGTCSEDEPPFPSLLGRCPRMTVGSGSSPRDVRDGCGRCSPGLLPLADRGFPTGVFRSMALRAMVDSPLAPRDVVFLEEHPAGKMLFAMCTTAAIVARQGSGC